MSTSLWPALLAAVLGGRQQHQHQQQEEQQQMMMMQQERALHPIQALLYVSVLGEHALYWWIGIVCFVGLAYATNPSEASFKTHLTDLSFHLHLRRLRAQDPDSLHGSGNSSTLPGDFRRSSTSASSSGGQSIASSASSASSTKDAITSTAGSTNTAGAKSNGNATTGGGKSKNTNNHNNVVNHQAGSSTPIEIKQRNVSSSNKQRLSPHNHSNGGGAGGVESGRPHVLSFSNRVSISLKTPAYVRTSYALWSTVRILPATPSSSSSQTSSSSSAKAVGGGSKGSNTTTTTTTAGTPGRPILNGVPAVTRRASTTLPGLNDRSSKKSSSTSGSGSSSSSSSSSSKNANSRKGGLVSTVAHGISASLASPVCSPWLEQGGYFIGFLGYWWTVDDGTSFSGAREKLRLGNALLAVEEQDEEDDVSVDQHGPEAARNADDLEGGHAFYDNGHAHSQVARAENQSNSSPQHMNGSSGNTTTSKRKQQQQQPSKASHGASMRGGQRRSSPTPRQVSNKKRGSGSGAATAATGSGGGGGGSAQASQVNSSGDVTPITPHSTVPLDRSRLEREGHHLLSTNDDSQLPGLPFHVDRNSRDLVNSNAAAQEDHRQFATVKEGGVTTASGDIVGVDGQTVQGVTFKEGEDAISTISHSASGPESTVATVSPALALLQSQLDDLRTSSAATQARLEAEVEELQIRKRDEDAVRTELKARTKILEESKREAELERLDAEKKLISARSVKKSVEDRVTKARSELSKLEKKEKEVQEKIQRAREERRIKLDSLREDVKKREALLVKEEEATEKLNKRVADLEKEIEERKHDLFQFRREEANAAAVAVTNRMNRAGRGLGPGPHPHTHGHGPHSGAAVTAKRHMHPPPHAHTTAHRHPSQHPNAAVPVAYPYISPEDQAKQSGNQARSSSPGATTPPPPSSQTSTTATGSAANAAQGASSNVEGGQTFGSAFMDHRMQSRRAASAAGTLGGQASAAGANHPMHSNLNTSVIGNAASAAGGLQNRHQLDRGEDDGNEFDDLEDNDGDDHDYESRNLAPGSTFAPFGPASPTSPSTIGAPSPRGQHGRLNASPGLAHMPYFASDKSLPQASQQPQNRLRTSTSREDFLAAMRSEVIEDDEHDHHARELDTTPVMRLASELAEDETDSYVLAKPRAITASGKRDQGGRTGGLRRESFDSVGSFTSSNGGPLSPMTPHQASLIPSQLFDMLDDVEMPASPTPYQVAGGVQGPHHTFTQGISDAFDRADNNDNSQPQQVAGTGGASRRGPGMYSPWADFDIDAGFDFDKPLGYGASASAGVSRKPSGKDGLAHHAELLRRRSGSPIGSGAFDATSSGAVNSGEGIFASYGPTHGHHGSVGSTGQRSNTSSSGGSISPSLMAAAQGHQQQQHQQHSGGNSAMNFPAGFGKLSPNDLLFDKARHVLSLNPDAKAFSFNRPLPSSGSAGSLNSIGGGSKQGGHNLPSNAVGAIGDARLAFDNAGAGSQISSGSGSDSPKLVNNSIAPGNATWASPNLTNRGLHNLGYGTGNAGGSGGNTLRESVRSASGPPLTNPTSSTGHSSSFSPFDDDDLLKGW